MDKDLARVRQELADQTGRIMEAMVFVIAEVIHDLHNQGQVDRGRLADHLEAAEAAAMGAADEYKVMVTAALLERLRGQSRV